MKRILLLAELKANKLGSMEEFKILLADELGRRGCVCYIGLVSKPDPYVEKMLNDAGAEVVDVFGGRYGGSLSGELSRIAALYRFIRDNGIDLVHINFYCLTDPCLLGVYLSGAKIVYTEHSSGSAPVRRPIKRILSTLVHSLLSRRISRYIAVSDFVREKLQVSHHVGHDKSVTIYNGVNLDRFVPTDRSAARKAAGVPDGAKVVTTVAMLIPEKGIHHLIEAAAVLVHEFGVEELCILVVGEGYYREALEKLAAGLGVASNVRFFGRRSDVDMLIAASDIVAAPSVWAEAFGLIIAEAMASGRPVIASRIGGIPEIIEDRVTGLLVEPGDSRGLAAGINELFNDNAFADRLAGNALEKTRRMFDSRKQATDYADLYDNLLVRGSAKSVMVLAEICPNKLGSSEEFDMFLSRELGRRGVMCHMGFVDAPSPVVGRMLEEAGARIGELFHADSSDFNIQNIARLCRYIKVNRIGLVHVNFYSLTNPYMLGVYLSEAKIVFTERTSGTPPVRGPGRLLASRFVHFFLSRRISRYVAVSEYVRARLKVSHHVGGDKTVTIYNAVNMSRFTSRDKVRARELAGLPVAARVVVTVAMLIPEKGIQHLVEAAAVLVHELGWKDLCVLVVGEGHYRPTLEKLAADLDVPSNVRFLGRRNDVDTLLAASDMVAAPSVWAEAFGLIIAEAMAAGRPVIASRIGGIPEIIEHGVTGLLVEPGDGRGLATGIRRILEEPGFGERLALNALKATRHRFDLERQVSVYADLFEDVMQGNP